MRLTQEQVNEIISRHSNLDAGQITKNKTVTCMQAEAIFNEIAQTQHRQNGSDTFFAFMQVPVEVLMAHLTKSFGPCAEPPASESAGQ